MSWFEMIWDHHDQREDGGHHVCGCEEKRLCWEGMGRHQVQGNFYIIGKRMRITIRDYHFHKKSNLFLEISKRYKSSYKKQTDFRHYFGIVSKTEFRLLGTISYACGLNCVSLERTHRYLG